MAKVARVWKKSAEGSGLQHMLVRVLFDLSPAVRPIKMLHLAGADTVSSLPGFKTTSIRSHKLPDSQTFASTWAFFLAMTQYPEVQRKAQLELDTVVGQDRLPEFSDLESLPYVKAVMKELLRWHIVAPIAVPRRMIANDEYNGYLLPGGATVLVNVWCVTNISRDHVIHIILRGISRDPTVYPDPERFIPERFIDSNGKLDVKGKDPSTFVFGFGRRWVSQLFSTHTYDPTTFCRICPGLHFAEASLAIMIASVLSTFDIHAPSNGHGSAFKVEHEVTTGVVVS